MTKNARRSTWVVVADGSRAQAYYLDNAERFMPPFRNDKYETRPVLKPVTGTNWKAPSPFIYEIGGHKLGAIFKAFGAQRHTVSPHADAHEEVKQHFMKEIALKLKLALSKKACEKLILVLPSRLLGVLRHELNGDANGRIIAVVPKDLTKCRPQELLAHLEDVLPQAA